jgi:hypothetical protein
MPNYSKNFLTSMTGYMNLGDPTGDPKPKSFIPSTKNEIDTQLDVRDILSNLVGNKYADWQTFSKNDNAKAQYASLIEKVGRPLANELVTQAISFNNRSGLEGKGIEDRIQAFYEIGSNNKQVADVLTKVKALGQGVVPAFRESILQGNQELSGKTPSTTPLATQQAEQAKQLLTAKIK